jgi:hypothetical protein
LGIGFVNIPAVGEFNRKALVKGGVKVGSKCAVCGENLLTD